ncbi:MAG: PKD domain-containing protein, partial [Myxococcota bacterium]
MSKKSSYLTANLVILLTILLGNMLLGYGCTIKPKNERPVATIESPSEGLIGEPVLLDGSKSSDPDGTGITYIWGIEYVPAGSKVEINGKGMAKASYIPDVEGEYKIKLVVFDGFLYSIPAYATIKVKIGNVAPVANAGMDRWVKIGSTVQLDGSMSYDLNKDPLTYQWDIVSKPDGSIAKLSDSTVVNPTFVADLKGEYQIRLVVSDGKLSSEPDYVKITAGSGNARPVANAGEDRIVLVKSEVELDGSKSYD